MKAAGEAAERKEERGEVSQLSQVQARVRVLRKGQDFEELNVSISEFLDGNAGAGLIMEGGVSTGKEGGVFGNSELRNGLQGERSEQEALPRFVPSGGGLAPVQRVSSRNDFRALQAEQNYRASVRKGCVGVMNRPGIRVNTFRVNTLYKRKADKVRPVDSSISDGSTPGGREDWRLRAIEREKQRGFDKQEGKFDYWLHPRTASFPRGQRLTDRRFADLQIGEMLTDQERELLKEMLLNREAALSWTFDELGRVVDDVTPPQRIRTVEHEAWQAKGFPIPRALNDVVKEMILERLDRGTLERCHSPYRNPWFLVKKKDKKYRIVNAAMWLNKHTIRDATLPPTADEFAERFSGMNVLTLADLHSGYDQIELDVRDRDKTAFMTPIGLVRLTTLPQGATNSVGQFVRVMNRILEAVHKIAGAYVDDIGIEGPKTDYEGEEVAPGIRRFVYEHIIDSDKVLLEIERAGATIGAEKTQWCMPGVKIVGYVCDSEGRHPDSAKVIKILDWPACRDPTEVKSFLGVCVYYRIWIQDFSIIAAPLYRLTKKNARWEWVIEHDESMELLKIALTQAPALVTIEYGEGKGMIIVAFDASKRGWGGVIMQEDRNGKRHPARFESGVWTESESNYDAGKRECRAMLKVLKKFRFWLYGVHFVVETDANTLVAQLNRSATDLPGALVTQWMAWIRLFDFEVRHVPGSKNVVADALSRRPATIDDITERDNEQDIDEWVSIQLSSLRVRQVAVSQTNEGGSDISQLGVTKSADAEEMSAEDAGGLADDVLDEDEYSEESRLIGAYLASGGQRPVGMPVKEFKKFKNRALQYVIRDGHLFRRPDKSFPVARRVLDREDVRFNAIAELHDDAGHRGREATYRRVADRYFWDGMWKAVEKYVKTCPECQKRSSTRQEETLHPTWVDSRWEKLAVDVVYMPPSQGKKFIVVARSDLSGWPEARALSKNNSAQLSKFLWEDIVCRHGVFRKVVMDGGPENRKLTKKLLEKYGMKRVLVSAYHPQANGMVERGHRPIVDSLSKLTNGHTKGSWVDLLPVVLWADRTSVRASTGMTPYEFEYASRPVLPIELKYPTWSVLAWDSVRDDTDLVTMRARALERREEDIEEARLFLRRMRERNKEYFDNVRSVRRGPIEKDCLVLVHNHHKEIDMSTQRKLDFRWTGPVRVRDVVPDKGTYILEDLNGARLRGTFAGNRIKRFYVREDILGHRLESERAAEMMDDFASTEDVAVEEEEDAAEIVSEEEEGVDEPVEQEDGGHGFWIDVPPVTPEMRRSYR
jgi:hypothetical protein